MHTLQQHREIKSIPVDTLRSYIKTCEGTGVGQEKAVALMLVTIVDMICEAGGPKLAKEVFREIITSIDRRTS